MRRIAVGAAILFAFSLGGEALLRPLGFASGGPLLGFFALSLLLRSGKLPLALVEDAANLGVRHLAYPIVGVTAGAVFEGDALADAGPGFAAAIVAGTLAVLLFVALVAKRLAR